MRPTVHMRSRKNWLGKTIWEMDETDQKPKTFAEKEGEAIFAFFYAWLKLSLIPAGIVGVAYLLPYEGSDELTFGYPWSAGIMFLAVALILNLPNYAIAGIRSLALWSVTYGRD